MTAIMYIVKGHTRRESMRVSREQVTENRRTILEAAGRLFRERGFEAVTISEIMHAAGLTHGGFYGYFTSKDELVAEALADAMTRTTTGPLGDLTTYGTSYPPPTLRDDRARGCPPAAFAAEVTRQTDSARAELTTGIRQQIE